MSTPELTPESSPSYRLDSPSWIDLRQYDQSNFDRGRPTWGIILWWFIQAITFPLTLHNWHNIRVMLLRCFGAKIGRGVVIRPTARFTYPWKVSIGDYSWIGDDVVFYSLDQIEIGQHCVISQKTYLCTGSHDIQDPCFRLVTDPIKIGNGVWIATDCFVSPGVKIGANSVVGARSSVFRSLPESYICWGTPAKAHSPRTPLEEN
ncbi:MULTISPECIES: hormogonium polysaccharide biosynthesis acetyltransferase HpsU [unclassified Roseofilum]|uniref:hormogonium polysaccharide biosynthesis acetyltransferase HpsU n=1 Tax=unclassified Roseofilum TaxID=2620099 RepID=UPI000E903B80|nr:MULTISPECIES: hormogonium polysaccharide biosynthesis acetyltransferase HpsU [unclassified Roseofilum]MBP0007202.1 hormogonium polysaccharide biosynthesis acetyltransferase HpsU [Roseofilum sp. Belize Diploria]MBP0031845.1 hormogonium polysaccharide biosynthesis acetyltransferase HpsU [Roseofilum sp. Belize BBD 4]HBQ98949.1 colanic acid biosynthesis acetyltransferase WcaF [Cyanobacteria bacterium UBA11691]